MVGGAGGGAYRSVSIGICGGDHDGDNGRTGECGSDGDGDAGGDGGCGGNGGEGADNGGGGGGAFESGGGPGGGKGFPSGGGGGSGTHGGGWGFGGGGASAGANSIRDTGGGGGYSGGGAGERRPGGGGGSYINQTDFLTGGDITGGDNSPANGQGFYECIDDNDDCANAFLIQDSASPAMPSAFGVIGSGNSTDGSSTCEIVPQPDRWYIYTAACDSTVTVRVDNSFVFNLAAFDACGGNELACDIGTVAPQHRAEITWSVLAGQTYLIRVSNSGAVAQYVLFVTSVPDTPANDNVAAAQAMGLGQTVRAQLCAATNDGTSTCAPGKRDVWFSYTSSGCDQLIELASAFVECSFSIHESPGGPAIQCQDNPWGLSIPSLGIDIPTMTWTQPPDTTYYIRASSDSTDALTFAITELAITCSDTNGVPPILTLPPDIKITCKDPTDPGFTGVALCNENCDPIPITATFTDVVTGNCPVIITRTWTCTDKCGNTSSADQIITINDDFPPVVKEPPDIKITCKDPTDPGFTGVALCNENCDPNPITATFTDVVTGNCPVIITRTWTCTDKCGNTSSADQIITINDDFPPVVKEPPDIKITCKDPTDPGFTGVALCNENCDPIPITATFTDVVLGNCPVTIVRTWTCTDKCGNSSSADQIITVNDDIPPVVDPPPDIKITCKDPTDPGFTGQALCNDNCDPNPIQATFTDVVTGNCPVIITRTWTCTDKCGNTSSADQSIIVNDDFPPGIICPGDVTVECDESTDPGATGMATAADNCDPNPIDPTFSDVVTPSDCLADPTQAVVERTWTATDKCGNETTCVQTITVLKKVFKLDIKPTSCPNPLNLAAGGLLPMALIGTADFDVGTVDFNSLMLSRADCAGDSVAVFGRRVEDVATPFDGALCDCHTLGGDGIQDLSLKVNKRTLVQELLGGSMPGDTIELTLSGSLDDGCEFIASDCVVVPGGCAVDADCPAGKICCGGMCTVPVCSADGDCDDADTCTADTCKNGGTCNASCSNTFPACGLADGCCGPACTPATDPDCDACGDGVCAGSGAGEDCFSCAADCRCAGGPNCSACCGDGVCGGPGENANNCPVDCGA